MKLFHSIGTTPIILEAHEGDLKHSFVLGTTARGSAAIGIEDPCIDAIKAIDGKIFAMLTEDEMATLNFYRSQGRKYGVSITIINQADPVKLAAANSQEEADHILKSANSRVQVTCSRFFQVERQDEHGKWIRIASTAAPSQALDLLTDNYRRVIDLSSGLEVDRVMLTKIAQEDVK
ncbi:MAG: hypothetical protein FD131_3515 [Rhodocyclaceae bacterium]|nr:MAG: hypothetical protein FD131_3515 [Rhodocyclaceae bacterium]